MTILTGEFAAAVAVTMPPVPASRPASGKNGDALPEDAKLYLRHVEGGESIRSLARESGQHASTILRRIRRFEARRDDPLIDRAMDRQGTGSGLETTNQLDQARRILRRLAEPGAVLAVADGMEKAIVTRSEIRTAVLDRRLAEAMALRGWVTLLTQGRIARYSLAPAGRAALKALVAGRGLAGMPASGDLLDARPVAAGAGMAEAAAPYRAAPDEPAEAADTGPAAAQSHRIYEERMLNDPEGDGMRPMRVNIAESPLLLLARRRDANGQPFLDAGMVAAAERLREDFELAQTGPRVAQNWDRFMTAGIDVSRSPAAGSGGSEAARRRVGAALRELGPGMGDLVLRVCCYLEGVELTERRLGWSARSGKVVLRLALMRLERHYRDTYGNGSPMIG